MIFLKKTLFHYFPLFQDCTIDPALGITMALAVSARLGCANLTSDNTAGVMPEVLAAVVEASKGTAPAYGNDVYTKRLNTLFSQVK